MAFDDTVIVKLEPLAAFLGAKERAVMSPVQVTTVNQNTLEVVDLRLRSERKGKAKANWDRRKEKNKRKVQTSFCSDSSR